MEGSSRKQTPQGVLDARKSNVQFVNNQVEAAEDVASRTSPTNMFAISAVQHISEKHPETCTREDSNIRTSSRRGNLTLSCIITRRSTTLVTSLTIMSVSYRDPLSRQVAEGVLITRCREEILNSKSEFRQPPIVSVRREVNTGV